MGEYKGEVRILTLISGDPHYLIGLDGATMPNTF
jgi:hypothetical protein